MNLAFLKNNDSQKMTKDILWNVLSLVILALGGYLINFFIAYYYEPAILGVFNQVFAIYILLSQMGVWGIHISVLKKVAQFNHDHKLVRSITGSGLVLVIAIGIVVSALAVAFSLTIARYFWSPLVARGIIYISPAILFFSINKVLLGSLNGQRKMFEFSAFQSARYILMLAFVILFVLLKMPGVMLSGIWTLSEFTLTIGLIFYFVYKDMISMHKKADLEEHFAFGSKVILGGVVAEFNTRVDVLFLGIFLGDYFSGLYSFALIFVEGFYQLYVVLKNNFNPIFNRLINHGKIDEFLGLKKKIYKYIYLAMVPLAVLISICFMIITRYLIKGQYVQGTIPLLILLFFMILNSPLFVFGDLLSQAGYPGSQTVLNIITVSINILLNIILIPLFGMAGSAIATGTSYIGNGLVLKYLVKKRLNLNC